MEGMSRRALWMNKLAGEVARVLTERIRAGRLAPGDMLPERAALAAEFVTSEGVVERALDDLAERGLLARDAGGRFVVAGDAPALPAIDLADGPGGTRADIVAVLELRMGVEPLAAALAAERRSDADLARIGAAEAAHAAAVARGDGIALADFRFHCAIAEASANPYIGELVDYLGPLLIPRMRAAPAGAGAGHRDADRDAGSDAGGSGGRDASGAGAVSCAPAEHARIVAAIAARDPEAARAAMHDHLARIIDTLRAKR